MNEIIKQILEKHNVIFVRGARTTISVTCTPEILNNAIIEICEKQKEQTSKDAMLLYHDGHFKTNAERTHVQIGADNVTVSKESIINSKNIAKP